MWSPWGFTRVDLRSPKPSIYQHLLLSKVGVLSRRNLSPHKFTSTICNWSSTTFEGKMREGERSRVAKNCSHPTYIAWLQANLTLLFIHLKVYSYAIQNNYHVFTFIYGFLPNYCLFTGHLSNNRTIPHTAYILHRYLIYSITTMRNIFKSRI